MSVYVCMWWWSLLWPQALVRFAVLLHVGPAPFLPDTVSLSSQAGPELFTCIGACGAERRVSTIWLAGESVHMFSSCLYLLLHIATSTDLRTCVCRARGGQDPCPSSCPSWCSWPVWRPGRHRPGCRSGPGSGP